MSSEKVVNDQLQNALANAINGFSSSIEKVGEKTVSFAQEQIPDVIHQYITWGFYSSLAWAIVCFIILILFSYFGYKALKTEDEDIYIPYFAFGSLIVGVPSFIIMTQCLINCLQIYVAPKVWLIQQAAALIK